MKIVATALAAVAIIASTAASAADLPRGPYAIAPPYPTYNWIGPYIGVNLGYEWGDVNATGARPAGVLGGVQAGYNWQIGQFVLGGEADFQGSDDDSRFASWKFSNPWFGTLRGRVGYAIDNVLLYATFGLAYGGGTVSTAGLSESHTHLGTASGVGVEIGLTPNWSAKAEYLFVDLSDRRYVLFGNTGFESNILRLGVNYRF